MTTHAHFAGEYGFKTGAHGVPQMVGTGKSPKGSVEYHVERIHLHAARARAHAINYRKAQTDAERSKHALAAATSLKYARVDAKKVAKATGAKGELHEKAQKALAEAEKHHASIGQSATSHEHITAPVTHQVLTQEHGTDYAKAKAALDKIAEEDGHKPKMTFMEHQALKAKKTELETHSKGEIKSSSHGLSRVKYNVEQFHKHIEAAKAAEGTLTAKGHELKAAAALKRAEHFHAKLTAMTGGVGKHHELASEYVKNAKMHQDAYHGVKPAPAPKAPTSTSLVGSHVYNHGNQKKEMVVEHDEATGRIKTDSGATLTEKKGTYGSSTEYSKWDQGKADAATKAKADAAEKQKAAENLKKIQQQLEKEQLAKKKAEHAATPGPKEMLHEHFIEAREEYTKILSSKEKSAIVDYSGSDYSKINGTLRATKGGQTGHITDKRVSAIDSGLQKYKVEHDTILHRGTQLDNAIVERLSQMPQGATWRDHAYVSTSVAQNSAFGGNVKFRITVPKGMRAAPIPSDHPNEKEMLLPRGSKMRVDKVEVTSSGYGGKKIVLHMTVIEQPH